MIFLVFVTFLAFLLVLHVEPTLIVYYLYTSDDQAIPKLYLDETQVDKTKPLVVIIHGYIGSGLSSYNLQMKDQFLKKRNVTVLLFDYSQNYADYQMALVYSKICGRMLADDLSLVYDNFSSIHLVGMGLGAHTAGSTAKRLKIYSNGTSLIGKISAIDPALPLINISDGNALSRDDASQVVVYHCDGNEFGIMEPIGTVDYYINGGSGQQPGCHSGNATFLDYLYGNMDQVVCSHRICRTYFINAINSNSTVATKCDSEANFNHRLCENNEKVVFGDNMPLTAKGKYYLNITEEFVY